MKFKYLIIISAIITIALLGTTIYTDSTGDFKCTNTHSAILEEYAKTPDATKAFKVQDRKDKLLKLCTMRPQVCGVTTMQQTPRVLEICQSFVSPDPLR